MDLGTTAFERVVHVALFVTAGVAFGVLAVAALERLAGAAERAVRGVHVAVAVGVPCALFVVERLYHALT